MFLLIWLICFIIVVILCRTVVNAFMGFMGFMGADWYGFSVGTRFIVCAILSAIIAFVVYACIVG